MEELALQLIEGAPVAVRRLAADLSDEQVRRRPAEDAWSMVEITGHLADKAEVWGERMRRIAVEERPYLPAYDQDQRVRDRNYQEQPFSQVLARLQELSTALSADLRRLPPEAWQRIGVHEVRGQMTLGEVCRIYAISLPDHVEQLVATRNAALAAVRRQ